VQPPGFDSLLTIVVGFRQPAVGLLRLAQEDADEIQVICITSVLSMYKDGIGLAHAVSTTLA
jgi:hypothetical protein